MNTPLNVYELQYFFPSIEQFLKVDLMQEGSLVLQLMMLITTLIYFVSKILVGIPRALYYPDLIIQINVQSLKLQKKVKHWVNFSSIIATSKKICISL